VAAKGGELRGRVRTVIQKRLRKSDDGAAQVLIERRERIEDVVRQRDRDRPGGCGELSRAPAPGC
jgi:hypothetical protein